MKYRVSFKLEAPGTLLAMQQAGALHFQGRWRFVAILQILILAIFAPLGGVMSIYLIWNWITGAATIGYWMGVVFIILAAIFMKLANMMYARLAQISVDAEFNKVSIVEISEESFTLMAPNSTWRTGWADVESVIRTETAFVVVVSAIALPVPITAFESEAEADQAFADMQRWHGVAVRARGRPEE